MANSKLIYAKVKAKFGNGGVAPKKNYHGLTYYNFIFQTLVICRFSMELGSTKKKQDPKMKLKMRH